MVRYLLHKFKYYNNTNNQVNLIQNLQNFQILSKFFCVTEDGCCCCFWCLFRILLYCSYRIYSPVLISSNINYSFSNILCFSFTFLFRSNIFTSINITWFQQFLACNLQSKNEERHFNLKCTNRSYMHCDIHFME